MRRALAWFVPRGPLGGAWRGALLVTLLLLADARGCGPHHRWERCRRSHLLWTELDGSRAALLLVGVGVGLAVGAALSGPLHPTPGATRAGRSVGVAASHAAGLAPPLVAWAFADWRRRRWIEELLEVTSPLRLDGDLAVLAVFGASVAAGLFVLLAVVHLRWPARGPLGPLARVGVVAGGLSAALTWPVAARVLG